MAIQRKELNSLRVEIIHRMNGLEDRIYRRLERVAMAHEASGHSTIQDPPRSPSSRSSPSYDLQDPQEFTKDSWPRRLIKHIGEKAFFKTNPSTHTRESTSESIRARLNLPSYWVKK